MHRKESLSSKNKVERVTLPERGSLQTVPGTKGINIMNFRIWNIYHNLSRKRFDMLAKSSSSKPN